MAAQFLPLVVNGQPNDTTCGPTCLQAVYHYYGLEIELEQLIAEVPTLDDGGTLAVLLGCHALEQGFSATVYTYNMRIFDPSWFFPQVISNLKDKLVKQVRIHRGAKRQFAASAYLRFLEAGGDIRMEDLSPELLSRHLSQNTPILTGLSSTWLYQAMREDPVTCEEDDERGAPAGHFVVVHGYDKATATVFISDPMEPNERTQCSYALPVMRFANAVLLGILTYDANLLIIHPATPHAH